MLSPVTVFGRKQSSLNQGTIPTSAWSPSSEVNSHSAYFPPI
jgi:hypothetical protein